ncbi:hypothetical protein [Legionella micdadei]|uniref:Uncharacterized protein n=1 Tax=Legionella micdadei TaxID=451 RepID=A0A098GEB2_LEGMI|nr:hypothetical protein [Legionella micdadei]ARG97615.1 hypothetical protein B6N58_08035 [Legionella micdadei]ARH00071.1 hypothetical protein B6V88_06385 [Legionella micdadei]KTD27701.1 hypothetical protein Lmic_2021 [Legionella micdadei]NSL17686.1 hypothetical protein [Legionella micdadei]CEG60813.1 protein of unknown function [Legionella micdadei]
MKKIIYTEENFDTMLKYCVIVMSELNRMDSSRLLADLVVILREYSLLFEDQKSNMFTLPIELLDNEEIALNWPEIKISAQQHSLQFIRI